MYKNNSDNNNHQCQKFSGKTFFVGFQLTVFENKRTFMEKKKLFYIQSPDALLS